MIMMMLMYYPMMKNYVIVYELLLVDFETIPKRKQEKKRILFDIHWCINLNLIEYDMWKKVKLQEKRNDTIQQKKRSSICSSFICRFFEQLFKMTRLDLRRRKSERMYPMCETSYNQSGNCTIKWTVLP